MGKSLDFKPKYASKILGIDSCFSKLGGFGWSILNSDAKIFGGNSQKPLIHRCGLIKPFSSYSNLNTMNDLCEKLIQVWRSDSGYSREPAVLVVELPVFYPGSPVSRQSIGDLILLVGMLIKSLSPQLTITPTVNNWKGNMTKDLTREIILNGLDFHSQKALERDLSSIAPDQRHNVFDAIGLALYGGNIMAQKIPEPRMIIRTKI